MYGMAANYGGGGNRGMGQPMPQRQQGYNRRPQGNNRNNQQNYRNSRFDQPQQNQNFNGNRGNNQNVIEEKKEPVQNVSIPTKTEAPTVAPAVVPVAATPKPAVQSAPVQAKPAPAVQTPVQAQPQATPTPQPQPQPQPQAPQQASQQRPQQQQQQQNRPQQQQQRPPQQIQQQRPQPQNQQQQQRPQQQSQQQQPRTQQQNQQQRPQQLQQSTQPPAIAQLQTVVAQPPAIEKASDNPDSNSAQSYNSFSQSGGQQGGGHQGGYQNHQGGQYNQNKLNNQFNKQSGGGRGMNQSGGGGGGFKRQLQDKGIGGSGSGTGGNREEHMIVQKLRDIGGPTLELPPVDQDELRFSGRSRLYIGNLTNDVTDQEILDMFAPYGETAELFINKEKNFAFIRIDHRLNAEKARRELDGSIRKGRPLRVRFAPQNSCVKVTNLTPQVSNELLYRTFEIFGKIERAIVKVDERGKSLCEGIIEFARKASAQTAIRYCTERCYFITASLRPVIVEPFEEIDEVDGYPEKNLPKKNADYIRAREVGPRFADLTSFEHEYGTRWKQLHELYRQKEEALKAELADERDKLEAQMELARYEQETEMLREALRRREAERERAELNWRAAGERREAARDTRRPDGLRILDDVPQGPRVQDDDVRRRQETTLFMQAQQLNSLLDQQEQGLGGGYDAADSKRSFIDQGGIQGSIGLDGGGYMEHGRQYGAGDRAFDGDVLSGGRWRHDDFPNKRRRY